MVAANARTTRENRELAELAVAAVDHDFSVDVIGTEARLVAADLWCP